MTILHPLAHFARRHGVTASAVLACLGLVLVVGIPAPALAATATPATPTVCTTYHVIPHGVATPATVTCLSHTAGSVKPNGPTYCEGDHLVIYQDANFKGSDLCFGAGSYNLTNYQFCAIWPFGCGTTNDQLSSFRDNTGNWGYMTTDINGGGNTLWFSGYQSESYVGATFNDRISYLYLS